MILSEFLSASLPEAMSSFFRQSLVPVRPVTKLPASAQDIFQDLYKPKDDAHQLIADIYVYGVIDDEIFRQAETQTASLFPEAPWSTTTVKSLREDYKGILLLGITLHPREADLLPTRTQLAEIVRTCNRSFPIPVFVVFKYGDYLSFSITERLNYKQGWRSGEKVGKVALLKDVKIQETHTGHLLILDRLKISKYGKEAITTFDKLYRYWVEQLSVSTLNKLFYKELFNWYLWAIQTVEFPEPVKGDATAQPMAVIRLLTRLIFVWFLKEKKLVSELAFDKDIVGRMLKDFDPEDEKSSSYYHAILQNLFFATLNTYRDQDVEDEEDKREFIKPSEGYLDQTKYRGEELFINPQQLIDLFADVPFLNGGLFENLDTRETEKDKEIRIDGFSSKPKKRPKVPNKLFFGRTTLDLSEALDDKKSTEIRVKGIIDILNSYKFTVLENTPFEEEVALDPELLGRVFENLLGYFNPETQTTARKQTGSFYTPREIVDYMVAESVEAYLDSHVASYQKLKKQPLNELQPNERRELVTALSNCKILDPACGSGAFPMGVLQRLVEMLRLLDEDNALWKETQKQKAIEETAQAFEIGNHEERKKRLKFIDDAFTQSIEAPDYARKLFLIENCIFGVDIQPVAVQISKLRFFISLLVEQQPRQAYNRGILSMPNLETKFVTANSLRSLDGLDMHSPAVEEIEEKLDEIRKDIFFVKKYKEKKKLKQAEAEKREALMKALTDMGLPLDNARLKANWNPFNATAVAGFFDQEIMFGPDVKPGFDIVIGNPPYLRIQGVQATQPGFVEYARERYKSAAKGNWDLYALFTERGYELLKPKGILAYIQPHKFFQADFGVGLRNLLAREKCLYQIVHFGAEQMFDSATNYTCLFFVQKQKREHFVYTPVDVAADWLREPEGFESYTLPQPIENQKWNFTNDEKQQILDKLRKQPETLERITKKIFQGLATSADKIYVLSTQEWQKEIVIAYSSALEREVEIERGLVKPFLMGKDVKRYEKPKPTHVVIFPYRLDTPKPEPMSPAYIQKHYPKGWKYLEENKKALAGRENGKLKQLGKEYYEYIYPKSLGDFDSKKIVIRDICQKPEFTFDSIKSYHTTTINSFVFSNIKENHFFYLGLLNSLLLFFYMQQNGTVMRGGYIRYMPTYLKPFPVKRINFADQQEAWAHDRIVALVEETLQARTQAQDTAEQEAEIDALVFQLYGFSEQEMLTTLLNMPDVSEGTRRAVQAHFRAYQRKHA